MNSQIILRGIKSPIFVRKFEAEHVLKIKDDTSISTDTMIHLGKTHFTKGEIKFVEINSDKLVGEKWNEEVEKDNLKGKEERRKFLSQTVEQKSNNFEMFNLLYKLTTDEEPSEEKKREAYFIQYRFFTEHPHRMLCDAHLLKKIIPVVNKPLDHFVSGGFRFLENVIFADMRESLSRTKL